MNIVLVLCQTKATDFPNALAFFRLPPEMFAARPSLTKALEAHAVLPFSGAHWKAC
jgi:hypothetical protein